MNLAEYFAANRPVPKYKFGDRVEGVYMKVPFVGTAYTEYITNLDSIRGTDAKRIFPELGQLL